MGREPGWSGEQPARGSSDGRARTDGHQWGLHPQVCVCRCCAPLYVCVTGTLVCLCVDLVMFAKKIMLRRILGEISHFWLSHNYYGHGCISAGVLYSVYPLILLVETSRLLLGLQNELAPGGCDAAMYLEQFTVQL